MAKKTRKNKYHLWNPFTVMDEFIPFLGMGPIVIERGEGPYVYNERGKQFINGLSSLWNVAIGHGRQELVDAAADQMSKLAYASCFRQTHPKAIELADRLVEITDNQYGHVYLGTNGSEAVEAALKMARQYYRQGPDKAERGRHKIVSFRGSYHGVSYGAVSTSGLEDDAAKYGPLVPGFVQIPPPYCYRCPYGKDGYPGCELECAAALEQIIQSEGRETVAAFIMEPILGAHGTIDPPTAIYERIGRICQDNGMLLIVDEVTTGFGRTGSLFVSDSWDIKPDILCLSKAISSGYLPLSATLATDEIYDRFDGDGNQFDHGSTASGHPVCAAVGLVNIDIIINENLPENAAIMGEYLKSKLLDLKGERELIGDIRGRGLMIGIELVKDREKKTPLTEKETFDIVLDFATLGLVVYYRGNIIGLSPPLTIDRDIADKIVDIFGKGLDTNIGAKVARKARLAKEFAAAKLL